MLASLTVILLYNYVAVISNIRKEDGPPSGHSASLLSLGLEAFVSTGHPLPFLQCLPELSLVLSILYASPVPSSLVQQVAELQSFLFSRALMQAHQIRALKVSPGSSERCLIVFSVGPWPSSGGVSSLHTFIASPPSTPPATCNHYVPLPPPPCSGSWRRQTTKSDYRLVSASW